MTAEKVLDKGFIEVIDHLGNDLTVSNSARVSFGKRKVKYDKSDERLVRYLAKNKHYSPFRHLMVQFHIKAPEFVMRQWYKHVVGAETTSSSLTKDHAWNEISGRYVPVEEYYIPKNWRQQWKTLLRKALRTWSSKRTSKNSTSIIAIYRSILDRLISGDS